MEWKFLDKVEVWCINLKSRPDRFTSACHEFDKINLLDRIKFYQPEKITHKISQKGCWDSHKYCMKSAYENNKDVLIFEDDIIFNEDAIKYIKIIEDIYLNNTEWEIFRLGSFIFQFNNKISDHLWSGYLSACHAYFIRYSFIEKCLKDYSFDAEIYTFPGIDEYFRYECKYDYVLVPQIAWQKNFTSDNKWLRLNFSQSIFENKYLFMFNQYSINNISWTLRKMPYFIKCLNPYMIMFIVSDYLNLFIEKIYNIIYCITFTYNGKKSKGK